MKKRRYAQLTQEQRYQIYALKKAGHGRTMMAGILEVHPATIGRELKRNAGQCSYRPKQAQGKAQQRRQERAARPRKTTIAATTCTTWHLVEQKLQCQWSPEQICGWLKKQHNLLVSHERIYQHVCAYTEVESIHPRETVFQCGSDDGIRVWLNGKVVHEYEGQRGHSPGSDEVAVHLEAGVNRILVKVEQMTGAWGFSLAVPKANF